ncbi:MAG: amidohydrolase family protein [Myxococcota bacterium]
MKSVTLMPSTFFTSAALAVMLGLSGCGPDGSPVAVDDTDTDQTTDTTDTTDTDDVMDTDDTDPVTAPDDSIALVTCDPPVATAGALCEVDTGTGTGLAIQGVVLTPDAVYDGGFVELDANGDITCVGCDCAPTVDVVRCPDGVVSPGLINPHDHLTFSENHPKPSNQRYEHRHDWRGSLSTPSNPSGTGADSNGNRWVEIRQLMHGTTTIVGSGAANGFLRNPDRGSSYMEGAPLADVENETFPLDDANESYDPNCTWDYKDDAWTVAGFESYVPHIAEGINDLAAEEFFCLSRSTDNGEDVTEPNAAHVHAMGLQGTDYYRMALDETSIIWSPRSNISLYGDTARVTTLDALGGNIALGTDWTYSGSLAMTRELACADQLNRDHFDQWFTDAELWAMATHNAATSIGSRDVIGAIEVGMVGDIAIFDGTMHRNHRAVIEAQSTDIALVVRGGRALYGDADVMNGIGRSCDAVDVCGQSRAICATEEVGTSMAAITADVGNAYPAFFCGLPDDEPSCTPMRPGAYDGPTTNDVDGDGIPNDEDGCPTVFDPIRPLDGGFTQDADADGIPDACDPSPVGDDLDGDTIPNAEDNCPIEPNEDQSDSDTDDRGDVCDVCPDTPNPDSVCPPAPGQTATIPEVRTSLALGTRVTIFDVVVTGVGSSGYSIQDPTVATGEDAGIYVFSGGTPNLAVGDVVTVGGELDEYFDELQLSEETVTVTATDGSITAVALTVNEAMTETYESVLVTLTDAKVTDDAYDCSTFPGSSGCGDAGLWELNGSTGVVVYDRMYEDSDWTAQIGMLPVTGVMGYRWGRRRIMPRTGDDLGN